MVIQNAGLILKSLSKIEGLISRAKDSTNLPMTLADARHELEWKHESPKREHDVSSEALPKTKKA